MATGIVPQPFRVLSRIRPAHTPSHGPRDSSHSRANNTYTTSFPKDYRAITIRAGVDRTFQRQGGHVMGKKTVAELLVDTLVSRDVSRIYGVPWRGPRSPRPGR